MTDYACALILKEGRLLLGRRAPYRKTYPSKWDVVGGKVEAGEGFEAALTRELGEEIGITPLRPQFFESLADRHLDPAAPPLYHYYLVEDWQGTPAICNHEHSDLQWFPFAEAAALPDLALPEYADLFSRLSFTGAGA